MTTADIEIDEETTSVEPDAPPEPSGRSWRAAVRRWVLPVVLATALAGAGYEGWLLYAQHQRDVAAAQALDTARTYAVTLTSTDPNAIDQNVTDIVNGATGEFKDSYTRASSQLRKMLIDSGIATIGTVVDAAVKSSTTDRVDVLLFVKQTVTNSDNPDPQTDFTAITMTMERVDGRWLASKVDLPSERR